MNVWACTPPCMVKAIARHAVLTQSLLMFIGVLKARQCLSWSVVQVTLIPRGQARGLTWFVPGEDPTLISKQQIFARIVGALGGRAAEEVIFGDAEVTTGASSDLQQVCSFC